LGDNKEVVTVRSKQEELVRELLELYPEVAEENLVTLWGYTALDLIRALWDFVHHGPADLACPVWRRFGELVDAVRKGDYRVLAVGVAGDRVRYLGYTPKPGEALLPPPPGDGEDPVLALKTLAERGVRFRRQGDRLAVFPAVAADDLFPLLEAIVPLAVRYLNDGEEVPASVLLSRVLGELQVPFTARA
jgi:hypothetical protein